MSSQISTIQTLDAAARAAMESAEWDTAICKLLQLQSILTANPNLDRDAGSGKLAISWNSNNLSELIANCRRQKAAATVASSTTGPWQTTKLTYTRP